MNPKQPALVIARAARRAQLASDVVQPADRARVHAGAGARRWRTCTTRSSKTRPLGFNIGIDATAVMMPDDPQDSCRSARDGARLSQGVGSGDADREAGRSSIRARGTAACCRPPAISSSRATSAASSSRTTPRTARSCGRSRRRPASSRRRSRTRSATSSTSWCSRAGAARTRSRAATRRAWAVLRSIAVACSRSSSAALPRCRSRLQHAALAKPPALVGDAQLAHQGQVAFHTYCSTCHGDSAVGGGVLPDLRWSPMNRTEQAWREVVIDGARKDRGMVSFAPVMSAAEAESIRAYVIKRANDTYEQRTSREIALPSLLLFGRRLYTSCASWGRSVSTWVAKPQVHAEL